MRRAKQWSRMVKNEKMIKHENERNQRSWDGSFHTRCVLLYSFFPDKRRRSGRVPQLRPALTRTLTPGSMLLHSSETCVESNCERATGNICWSWFSSGHASRRRWLVPRRGSQSDLSCQSKQSNWIRKELELNRELDMIFMPNSEVLCVFTKTDDLNYTKMKIKWHSAAVWKSEITS